MGEKKTTTPTKSGAQMYMSPKAMKDIASTTSQVPIERNIQKAQRSAGTSGYESAETFIDMTDRAYGVENIKGDRRGYGAARKPKK